MDRDRIAKAREDIEKAERQVRGLVEGGKEAYLVDSKAPLALKYLLITLVEAVTDICQHLLAKTKGVACEGYVDCIVKAGAEGIVDPGLANRLRRLADLRNSLVHRYWVIDDERLFEETAANVETIRAFLEQVGIATRPSDPL